MKSTTDTIFDQITDSAKKKFDYESFRLGFEDLPEYVPENFLFGVISGYAIGDEEHLIRIKLHNEILMLGFIFELDAIEKFLIGKKELFSKEIFITGIAIDMLNNGSDPLAVLNFTNQFLN